MMRKSILVTASSALALVLAAAPGFMHAQTAGPMEPPESTKFPAPPPPAKPEPPALQPDEIIRRFAAKEDEMVRALKSYTFQKDVRLQEIGSDNRVAGQFEIVSQVRITPDGKMMDKPVNEPPSTLHVLDLHRGDTDLLAPAPMFPLTTAILPKYTITYGGRERLDELNTYYFDVKPRALERLHAYFSGVVWVDTQDLVIVKTLGKWVTETGDITADHLPFTVFETYRQQVGQNYWFPAYSRSDDYVPSGDASVPVRIIVKWTDFTPLASAPTTDSPAPAKPADNKGTP